MTDRPRVVLIGFGPTALAALSSLLGRVDVVALARGTGEADDPVCQLAAANAIPLSHPRSRREVAELVQKLRPDCTVISSYNRTLEAYLLESCIFLNVHYAPLPRLRGNAPVNWALLNGATETAITIHKVTAQLDSGNVVFQEFVPISAEDDATSLFERLNGIQERELGTTVLRVLGGWTGWSQDDTLATYGCARNPEDGEIDWRQSAAAIARLTKALTSPFPGAFTYHQGVALTIHRARETKTRKRFEGVIPGRIVDVSTSEDWIDVLTGDGILRVFEMSRSEEPPRPAAHLISSRRARLGLSSTDLLKRIGELEGRIVRLERRRSRLAAGSEVNV